jgi:hypothetical protein
MKYLITDIGLIAYSTESEVYKALMALDETRRPIFLSATDSSVEALLTRQA